MSDSSVSFLKSKRKYVIMIYKTIKKKQDPSVAIREQCGNSVECRQFKNALEECNKRVKAHPGSHENCEEELFDFLQCVDRTVSF